jgi:hypothetical protein
MSAHIWFLGSSYRDIRNDDEHRDAIDQNVYRKNLPEENIKGTNYFIKTGSRAPILSEKALYAYLAMINECDCIPEDELYTDEHVEQILQKIRIFNANKASNSFEVLKRKREEEELLYMRQHKQRLEEEQRMKEQQRIENEKRIENQIREWNEKQAKEEKEYRDSIRANRSTKFDIDSAVILFKDDSIGDSNGEDYEALKKKNVNEIVRVTDFAGDVPQVLWGNVLDKLMNARFYNHYRNNH